MTEQDVQGWLDAYGRAWVDGEPDAVVALISATATYRETPFENPMRGQHAMREYWQQGAAEAQEDVEFASQVWAVAGDTAIAGWQARSTRKASGAWVELDGTFRLVFSTRAVHGSLPAKPCRRASRPSVHECHSCLNRVATTSRYSASPATRPTCFAKRATPRKLTSEISGW